VDRDDAARKVLKRMKDKRGYLLPYHELFGWLDPALLENYDQFYTELTLKPKVLDEKTKELVWIGILAAASEEAGTIHLKRARQAGITDDEISEVMLVTQVAKGFDVLLFFDEKWGSFLPGIKPLEAYGQFVRHLKRGFTLPSKTIELIWVGVYAALEIKKALQFHLVHAKEEGARDEEIAEAMSFIIIPRGGNTLLKAAEVLKDLVKAGKFKPDSIFKYWLSDDEA
jgi:alkylhydroperoxidase/carboxymuconolactone decarboxylase family protein YurZ